MAVNCFVAPVAIAGWVGLTDSETSVALRFREWLVFIEPRKSAVPL